MTSTNVVAENLAMATALIREAADQGADLVLTPECTTLLEHSRRALLDKVAPEAQEPAIAHFAALAQELGLWLLIGSIPVLADPVRADNGKAGDKVANRSFFFSPEGKMVARYDKIHMFDVDLPGGEQYRESRSYAPGRQAVLAGTPWGELGLSICYDLRFAHLYRKLAQGGAVMLSVPAAFTRLTGAAHWHVLLRARAIETGCFVFAPAQTGTHVMERQTYGHSLIVDPWGTVIADGGTDPGVVVADIDLADVSKARTRIPSLHHDRDFVGPSNEVDMKNDSV
tara:strand:+ start:4676 stop:5527 length:852 start_codon:yes stop_codon:yes gene_type:complete